MKKRRQHYVWQYYLKPWTVDGKILCSRNGRLFKTSTSNVAVKMDFYRLREFTEQDIEIVQRLCLRRSSPELQEVQNGWIEIFSFPFKFREVCENLGGTGPAFDTLFDKMVNDLEEDLHARIEDSSVSYLNALRKADLQFLNSDNELATFLHFVCVQYMRTDKTRSAMIEVFKGAVILDIERVWGVLSHILATNISHYLFMNRNRLRISILRVDGAVGLITSDQPLINIRALGLPFKQAPQEFELYYPVSPTTALLLEADQAEGGLAERNLESAEAAHYNRAMFQMAHEQVFALDEDTLRCCKPQ